MVNTEIFAQIIFNSTTIITIIITNRRCFDHPLKSGTQSLQYLQLLSPANFNLLKYTYLVRVQFTV